MNALEKRALLALACSLIVLAVIVATLAYDVDRLQRITAPKLIFRSHGAQTKAPPGEPAGLESVEMERL